MTDRITPISAFENESDAVTLGSDFSIENRIDRVSIFGSLDLTRDKKGLRLAMVLKANVDAIVAKLQSEHLPEEVKVTPPRQVDNPFGGGTN